MGLGPTIESNPPLTRGCLSRRSVRPSTQFMGVRRSCCSQSVSAPGRTCPCGCRLRLNCSTDPKKFWNRYALYPVNWSLRVDWSNLICRPPSNRRKSYAFSSGNCVTPVIAEKSPLGIPHPWARGPCAVFAGWFRIPFGCTVSFPMWSTHSPITMSGCRHRRLPSLVMQSGDDSNTMAAPLIFGFVQSCPARNSGTSHTRAALRKSRVNVSSASAMSPTSPGCIPLAFHR
mmetsp:Transcript_57185/g.140297  ORF Transcript_57185/g.140297 Transcript_57185/m.140297 type:complete len:230 (+) Transcript_57185:1635-2324(+)